jgi:hypothetical protein
VRRLVQLEIELARVEFTEKAKRAAISAGLIGAGLAFLLLAVIYALGALPEHFGPVLFGDSWQGWAVLGLVFFILAVALAVIGGLRLKRIFGETPETVTTVKENLEWARRLTRRSGSSS